MKPILCAAFLGMASTLACAADDAAPHVTLDSGRLRGVSAEQTHVFKGIPFAAAPVGALRWRPPQPVEPWSGVREARDYGPDCMQEPFASDAAPLGVAPSEDCLYLNVWAPDNATPDKPLPVMVWIYGGGFVNGGASPATYSGEALARQGIVVVSFNYRVGRFGFFGHPQLAREAGEDEPQVNYGFMDQLAALHWVQRNIAAFGGNPQDVTVAGESAGGMSIHTLMTSPLAQGLFHKAVIQSGGNGRMANGDLASAQRAGITFGKRHAIAADDPQALRKLRALSAEEVTDGLNMAALFRQDDGAATFTPPVIDGKLAVDVPQAYARGHFSRVPVMIGATSADLFGPQGPMIQGARQLAEQLSAQGVPTYRYLYSYVAQSQQAKVEGAPHASEIPFFLGTYAQRWGEQATARDAQASQTAMGYLVNFIKQGDPNGAGLPEWPRQQANDPRHLDFTRDGGARLVED